MQELLFISVTSVTSYARTLIYLCDFGDFAREGLCHSTALAAPFSPVGKDLWNPVWGSTPAISTLRRHRQENVKCKASLGYIVRPV